MFIFLSEIPEHIADLWLKSIARGTMYVLCEEVLRIHELTPHGTKQLVTDIGKWCSNVLKLNVYSDFWGLHVFAI